jgi:hypothetical protein
MKKITILIFMMLVTMAIFVGCTKKSDQNVADAKTAVNEATTDVKNDVTPPPTTQHDEWLKYKADMEAKIADNNKMIADYKVKMTDAKGKLAVSYDKKIDALEKKNKELKMMLDNYKEGGKDTWDKFKTDFDKQMDALGVDIKKITDKVKK